MVNLAHRDHCTFPGSTALKWKRGITVLEDRTRFIAVMQCGAIKASHLYRPDPTMVKREK